MKEYEAMFILEDGSQLGNVDYTRWDNAKWWQKIIGTIFYRYKRNFIDVKPFNIRMDGHENS